MFAVVVKNYRDMREIYGTRQMDVGLGLIGVYLKKNFKDLKVFYYRSGRFILLGDDKLDRDAILYTVRDRFKEPWKSEDTELYLDAG